MMKTQSEFQRRKEREKDGLGMLAEHRKMTGKGGG
jgi:hypothetical protein